MKEFVIEKTNEYLEDQYLKQDIQGFYHTNYYYSGSDNPEHPQYINTLKNDRRSHTTQQLNNAVQELRNVLLEDLPKILKKVKLNSLMVCTVPRAKQKACYNDDQLRFHLTVKRVVNQLPDFENGTNFIFRDISTKPTHLNYRLKAYLGITTKTCIISDKVRNKNILLIDDVYTKSINIDEDAIQALIDKGANSVIFYAIGRTIE